MEELRESRRSALIKRSLVVDGHKTSVSLENEFWDALNEIATVEKTNRSRLVRKIDGDRKNVNLSSAIRVFVFSYFLAQSRDLADTDRSNAISENRGEPRDMSAEDRVHKSNGKGATI